MEGPNKTDGVRSLKWTRKSRHVQYGGGLGMKDRWNGDGRRGAKDQDTEESKVNRNGGEQRGKMARWPKMDEWMLRNDDGENLSDVQYLYSVRGPLRLKMLQKCGIISSFLFLHHSSQQRTDKLKHPSSIQLHFIENRFIWNQVAINKAYLTVSQTQPFTMFKTAQQTVSS